jgi:hypothetical protein
MRFQGFGRGRATIPSAFRLLHRRQDHELDLSPAWLPSALGQAAPLRHLTRMPPIRHWSSADLDAAIARITPDVLALLADGVPRAEAAIVTALDGRHAKDEVTLALMRLDVLGQLVETGGKHILPAAEAGQGKATTSEM